MENIACTDSSAVIARVGLFSRSNDCAFQRYAGEQTFAPAVRVNGRGWSDVCLRGATHRASRCAYIGADGDIPSARERTHRIPVIEDDDKIGQLSTDLQSPAGAARAERSAESDAPGAL